MPDPRDRPLDLVAELLATEPERRPARLAKLPPPMLVRLAAAALEGWSRERERAAAKAVLRSDER